MSTHQGYPLRKLAPSGSPVRLSDLAHWAGSLAGRRHCTDTFIAELADRFGDSGCFLFNTGRSAMSFVFSCLADLAQDADRTEIIVPSYTCYSVPSSALKAGLSVRVCDIDPDTLTYRADQLAGIDFSKVLAIVTANLYGLPDNLPDIEALAREQGIFLIDDAAQCMNGKVGERYSGYIGDAGILSLDKGKNITSIQGGILVIHSSPLLQAASQRYAALPEASLGADVRESVKLLVYTLFLRPWLYWIPASLPFLDLGGTVYTEAYPIEKYSNALCDIALGQLRRVDEITRIRQTRAGQYRELLDGIEAVRFVNAIPDTTPVYLRFPVFLADEQMRDLAVERLNASGIGATASYPRAISDIPEISARIATQNDCCEGGRFVASHIMTLPTHAYVKRGDIRRCAEILSGLS